MTLYVWNAQRSLFLAANIKRRAPETLVIVGGPEVTPDNRWVLEHPAVDAGVFGEGESRIARVLAALPAGSEPLGIPGIFFKDRTGLHTNLDQSEPWDLGSCPYPYLDERITPSRDGTLFLETVRGCRFRCRYCYYHKAFPDVRLHSARCIEAVLDFAYATEARVREIYLMDPTFNAAKRFRDILRLMAARRSVKEIAVHTELRADLLSPEDVLLLKDAGLKSAEVGLQTTNAEALRLAGRLEDPEKAAHGIKLLKDAGIEVTTGIILGLPGDTPEGLTSTLAWLKRTGSYSVVHPFVLSVLPGTDFRVNAEDLGLKYDNRPPYYVQSTMTFSRHALQHALLECERTFDMELDHIARPSLVDHGPDVVFEPSHAPYISKWIVVPGAGRSWTRILSSVIEKATDPFTLWFNALYHEKAMLEIIREFVLRNPHAVLNIVLDYPEPPPVSFLESALEAAADPGLFVNRSYQPLYGPDAVVTPDFTVILPDPGDPAAREEITESLLYMAAPVWERSTPPEDDLPHAAAPVLLSRSIQEIWSRADDFFRELQRAYGEHREEVLFRDSALQQAWDRRNGRLRLEGRLAEKILVTGRRAAF